MSAEGASTDIHVAVQRIESSPQFVAFQAQHPRHFLVHVFANRSPGDTSMELGYFCEATGKVTVFRNEPIEMVPAQEVLKDGACIALDLTQVRLGLADALQRAETERARSYAAHNPVRHICVLSQQERPVWSITTLTRTYNLFTVRLDAGTGSILHSEFYSLMSIMKQE